MSLNEATLKRQLGHANEDLSAWIKVLESQGIAKTDRRKDAVWRGLNAACNTIRTRLKTVAAIKTREEGAAKRKAEKATAPAEPKVSKKGAKDAKGKPPKAAKDTKAAKEPKPAHKDKDAGGKGEKKSEAKEKKKKD